MTWQRRVSTLLLSTLILIPVWFLCAVWSVGAGPPLEPLLNCPDAYEPNDNFNDASPITPGQLQSYICDQNDMDYFRFWTRAGDTLNLTLTNLSANYDICLFDPQQQQLLPCSSAAGTKDEFLQWTVKQSGYYYALIYGVQSAYDPLNPYRFVLNVKSPTPTPTLTATPPPTPTATPTATCPDPFEPNDTHGDAWDLAPGGYQSFICTETDLDWYKVIVEFGQQIDLTLFDLPKPYDLELYDGRGRLVAGSYNLDTASESISYVSASSDSGFRVHVYGVGGAHDPTAPYALEIELGSLPTPSITPTLVPSPTATPTCPPDPYEPNDTVAAEIDPGVEVRAYLCPAGDRDYYSFHVDAGQRIVAETYELPSNYELALITPDRLIVARDFGSPGATGCSVSHTAMTSGYYEVRVMEGSGVVPDENYALLVQIYPGLPMTLYPVADAYISEAQPYLNFGRERLIQIGRDEFGQASRGLFRFSLFGVPRGTIDSAYLVLRLDAVGDGYGLAEIQLMQLLSEWGEYSVTWDTPLSSVTRAPRAWVAPVIDHDYVWDVTELVQQWLSGEAANHGLGLIPGEGSSIGRAFCSREYGAYEPKIIINFEGPAPGDPGSISGTMYEDTDHSGAYDAEDSPIPDVRIELFRRDFGRVDGATTGTDGTYSFTGLPADGGAAIYEVTVDEMSIDTIFTYEWLGGNVRSVYMSPGHAFTGIDFRVARRPTPTPGPPPTLNLTAEALELIQAVSGEPLVRNKHTLARLYVGVSGVTGMARGVTGRLYRGTDYVHSLAPADLIVGTTADPTEDPHIVGNLDRTVNFLLPEAWTTEGSLRLVAWVNYDTPGAECAGCWNSENQLIPPSFTFRATADLFAYMIPVRVSGREPSVDTDALVDWARAAYPVREVQPLDMSPLVVDYDFTETSDTGCGTPWNRLQTRLWWRWATGHVSRHYFGMIDNLVPHGAVNGCGNFPPYGRVASGIVGLGDSDRIFAHEIGHNLDRQHVNCNGTEGDPDPSYPHAGGLIGVYGVDMRNPSSPDYMNPTVFADIMSYCNDQWISDYTYDALLGSYELTSLASTSASAEQEYLIATGRIVDGLVTLTYPYHRLSRPIGVSDEPGQGRYALELQDVSGTPLFTRYFDGVRDCDSAYEPIDIFLEMLPWQQGTQRVAIKDGESLLHLTHLSANPPQVTVLSPSAQEQWPAYGQRTVTWAASDADDDPLHFLLEYSADGGDTWLLVDEDVTGRSYALSAEYLPGGDAALIRVTASDGLNVSSATSDAFTVEPKPPKVHIIGPPDGARYPPGRLVVMEARATDLEDGAITDETRFRWSSSRQGDLGQSTQLRYDDLEMGLHTLSVAVTDGDGFTSTDSVSMLIGHWLLLPLVEK